MRKILLSVLAINLAFSISPALAEGTGTWVEGTQPPVPKGSEAVSVWEYGGFEQASHRVTTANVKSSGIFDSWLCDNGNTGLGNCNLDNPKKDFGGVSIFPFCTYDGQFDCLEGLTFYKADGTEVVARYLRSVKTKTFDAIPSQNLPAGGAISLFEADLPHAGGSNTYAVNVFGSVWYNNQTKKFVMDKIDASVYGYNEIRDPSYTARSITDSIANGKPQVISRANAPADCKWTEDGACGQVKNFAPDVTIKISIRANNKVTGWFRGRMQNQEIAVEKVSSKSNRITVSAKPVQVARFYAVATKENTTPAEYQKIMEHGGNNGHFNGGGTTYPFSNWGEFEWIEMFRDIANDTAVGTSTHWNFSTIDNRGNNKCLSDTSRVLGIVTTNATMYNGVVPEFKNGTLNYTVSGMHYLPGGEDLNLGTYDLVMRSDVARCLYGFSKAPLSANVAVINDKGGKAIATTVVKETKDGWLQLSAYGFTFSKKTIKVKITKKKK